MVKSTYRTQFLNQLNNVELCLDDRLHMAYGAVISQDFPLHGKEQIIIDWFAGCLGSNVVNLKSILKILLKCLKSDWMLSFCDAIDASKIIEAFEDLDGDTKDKHSKSLVSCLILVLQNSGFQRFCRFDIQPMCQAVLLTFELLHRMISTKGTLEDSFIETDVNPICSSKLEDIFECIYNIHKVTQQRSELQLRFVKFFLPSILKFRCGFQQSTKFQNLLEEIVIGEDSGKLCEAFKSNTSRNIPAHLKALVKLMTESENQCDVVPLNSLLLDVYVQTSLKKCGSESSHIYLSLFYMLTSVAGFQLQLPYETVGGSSEVSAQRLSILTELVAVLQKHNISASSESEEGVLSNFLVTILKQLISEDNQLSSELLQAIDNILNVYPESVRLVFSGFLKHIVFVIKSDAKVVKSYNSLLMNVVKIFSNLNQIEKFFSLLFHGGLFLSKEQNFSKLTSEMVLSGGFYLVLSEKLTSLTGNQLKAIIGRLEKNFSKNLISQIECSSPTDANLCLLVRIIVQVICHVLENVSIAMPTRWNIINGEMRTLVLAVQEFGIKVTKSSDTEFVFEFLQLVKVLTDIELIMNEYVISLSKEKILPAVKSKDKSGNINNLSKSHGFLQPTEWKGIAELVQDSYDKRLKYCWYELLIQKYIRLSDPEVITHLTLTAGSEWLWQTVGLLASSVPWKQLELYTDQLLSTSCFNENDFTDKLLALSNISITTNRAFRAAMNVQLLKQISKILHDKHALSKKLVKLIDTHSAIKHEADFSKLGEKSEDMNAIMDALAEVLNKNEWEQTPVIMSKDVKEHLSRLIDLLIVMSPHSLKPETKRIIFLALVGLTQDFRAEESLLHSILEVILGCMDDNSSIIAESLDRRVLVHWLVTVVPPGFPLRQQLTQVAVHKVLYSLDRCVDGMSEVLQGNDLLLCTMLEALNAVRGNKGYRDNKETHKLVRLLVSLSSVIVVKKPKAKFIRLYTAALKAEFLFFKDKSPSLTANLRSYLEKLFKMFAENAFVEPNATELIDFTLNQKNEIEPEIVDMVYKAITQELCRTDVCPILCYTTTVKTFFECLQCDTFEKSLNEIYQHQQKVLTLEKDKYPVSNVCELWNVVVNAHVDKDKAKVRQKMLTKVLSQCQPLLEEDASRIHPVVIQLLYSIIVSKSVVLSSKLVDLILMILEDVATDTEAHFLPNCLSVLNVLISVRSELIFDRIPAFLQRLRKFIRSLVMLSSTDRNDRLTFNSTSSSCVNQVTRIIKTMTDHHGKHFARIAPYLIADILHLLVSYPAETSVKEELQNCVCSLLSICDHHSTLLLQNLLPLADTELYKTVSTTFLKSHKYTGKV